MVGGSSGYPWFSEKSVDFCFILSWWTSSTVIVIGQIACDRRPSERNLLFGKSDYCTCSCPPLHIWSWFHLKFDALSHPCASKYTCKLMQSAKDFSYSIVPVKSTTWSIRISRGFFSPEQVRWSPLKPVEVQWSLLKLETPFKGACRPQVITFGLVCPSPGLTIQVHAFHRINGQVSHILQYLTLMV